VDGDGRIDLYFCRMDGPNVLYRNLGDWKFEDITERAGVACAGRHSLGAVFADVNGDGALDLIVLGYGGPNSLFINDGKGHFKEEMSFPGRGSTNGSVSAALADIDGNGTLDLYIANHRYHTIKELLTPAELKHLIDPEMEKVMKGIAASPEFLERFTPQITRKGFTIVKAEALENGEADVLYLNDGQGHFTAATDERFLDADGKPMGMPRDWGLAVQIRDINGDGYPDIYVCNDFWTPDRLWLNDGHGHFRLAPKYTQRHISNSSMGVDFADINRDGLVDFFTVEMLSREHERQKRQMGVMTPTPIVIGQFDDVPQIMQNCLFLNRGDGTFTEIAMHAGLKASEWSWSPIFLDVDLDGYEDVLISTGTVRDNMDHDILNQIQRMVPRSVEEWRQAQLMFPKLATRNFIFRNRGDLTFEDTSEKWGFNLEAVSGGMIVADLDNDGDLDVIINDIGSAAEVYRNDTSAPRVAVRLNGLPPNRQGIGARLKLSGGPVVQTQEVIAGGHYASGSDALRVFAAGTASSGLSLEVTWRSGRRSVVPGVKPNCLYLVDEAGAQAVVGQVSHLAGGSATTGSAHANASETPGEAGGTPAPLFEDVSEKLGHRHQETPFDDFKRQPLLPNRLSQLGPSVAWFDLNHDGAEDLIVGSGRGGRLAVFLNDGHGGFKPAPSTYLLSADMDQSTVLGWQQESGVGSLLVGLSNFENAPGTFTNTPSARQLSFGPEAEWALGARLPGQLSTTGPMALGDLEGNGDLSLFVGGRTIPGRYPEPASSRLYKIKNGRFELDEKNSALFSNLGLVTGAVFGDLGGDGLPELILTVEWGPIMIFHNEHGQLTRWDPQVSESRPPHPGGPLRLSQLTGWWNSVTLGDLDGDGQLDIVAANWGSNSKYEGTYDREHPLEIFYGDFQGDGNMDIVEAYHDAQMDKLVPVRGLSCSSTAMPFVKQRTPTYKDFGAASCAEIYGDKLKDARRVQAIELRHLVLLNLGQRFEAVPLPAEAQLSPGFGLCVADFDGDGKEDIFLAQNFYAVQIETPRNDAGRGLLLRGAGTGRFEAVGGQLSGIRIYGEQRGAAACDYDHDGRADLAVAQNGAETKLYHNRLGRPGLRVRLEGRPGNPSAAGALMRLMFGDRKGPARPILAGSGYWSQDAAVQVLAQPAPAAQLWVRWPGGHVTTSPIPAGAQEIAVNSKGEVKVGR
jgi:hypothetical protein